MNASRPSVGASNTDDLVAAHLLATAQATDPSSLDRHFGGGKGLLPLWIAEPYVAPAPTVASALATRAGQDWFGYEIRPESSIDAFWKWMADRHQWSPSDLQTIVSPSVGTSIGVLIDQLTKPGDGIILQAPVFTDFKPLITSAGRQVVRNSLVLDDGHYRMDFDDLIAHAAQPTTTALILCNPHNPVGRVWKADELAKVAAICLEHDVAVIADEIHADIVVAPHIFTPFATVAIDPKLVWAALHGPIKTFGLAGVCDTLVVSNSESVVERFEQRSSQLHLNRNNVFGLAAFETAYRSGGPWLDQLLDLVQTNVQILHERLPPSIELVPLEGTYLAWLDFRGLGMDVPELATWLAGSARLGLSPGHWFGRDGAGFARMTIAAPTEQIAEAAQRLQRALL
jgi:cystathionine beta-lyase